MTDKKPTPPWVKPALLGMGLVALLLIALWVGPLAWDALFESDSTAVSLTIYRLDPDERPDKETTRLNETSVREEVPGFAEALDEMIRTGDKRKSFQAKDQQMGWCDYLQEHTEGCLKPFWYSDIRFEVFFSGP